MSRFLPALAVLGAALALLAPGAAHAQPVHITIEPAVQTVILPKWTVV